MFNELLVIASKIPFEKLLLRLNMPEPPKLAGNPGSVIKEPWQMTIREFQRDVASNPDRYVDERLSSGQQVNRNMALYQFAWIQEAHKNIIQRALSEGKPVPASILASVLKNYPDLASAPPPMPVEEIVRRERQGGSCIICLENKHLPKAKDALIDALNIYNRHKQFTDIAEAKIQDAVFWLAGAESDLEKARVSPAIKPAVDELRTEVGKLRHFMRVDESGLELATVSPKNPEAMKADLEKAIARIDELIKSTYSIVKIQIKEREAVLAAPVSQISQEAKQTQGLPTTSAPAPVQEPVAGQTP